MTAGIGVFAGPPSGPTGSLQALVARASPRQFLQSLQTAFRQDRPRTYAVLLDRAHQLGHALIALDAANPLDEVDAQLDAVQVFD